ncbi:MAG: C4-dicarboxylate ABC transporter [Spirochaetales bacterium]|jgi:tellurite resistance protein|nr:SLAC1 anion channel family protein [Exilispira sp.]NMC67657.1 C4-dicarboxylate ABC transporter [Spirochaetales bacterium]
MKNFLKNFPVSIFSIVMGIVGVSLATEMAQNVFQKNLWINRAWFGIGFCVFIIIFLLYLMKMIFAFKEVKEEFLNPISINFFSTISISFLLIGQGFRTFSGTFALILIFIGTFLQLLFSFIIISQWIRQTKYEIHHMNPSWFIPVVGNLLIPVFAHQIFPVYVEWFFFSSATLFYIILLPILIYRLIFHHPLVDKLVPTLLIFIAPASIAALAYYQLTGQRNPTVVFFYCSAFFFFILLFFLIDFFFKIKFDLSWWAYTFPLAAFSISTLFMSGVWSFLRWFDIGLIILLNLITLGLLVVTLIKLIDGKLFINQKTGE